MGSCRWSLKTQKLTGGMGTKCFRPPEMDTCSYGKPSDIYCLAVTVIYLLHGGHPIKGFNPLTAPYQWQQTLKVYQSYISTPMYELLRQMIATKPNERIIARDALQHDFFNRSVALNVPEMIAIPYPGYYWKKDATHERRGWIEMIIDLGLSYYFSAVTITHAVHLYDDFISSATIIHKTGFELYACVALWMAAKYFEEYTIPLKELVQYTRNCFTTDQFIDAEEKMITKLDFRIVRRPCPKFINAKSNLQLLKQILASETYTIGEFAPKQSLRLIYKINK